MRKVRVITLVCAGLMCLAATIAPAEAPPGGAAAKPRPGDEPYAPSKLEWAAIELNGIVSTEWDAGDAALTRFQTGTDGTTLTCVLRYRPVATARSLNDLQSTVRGLVERYARTRGWTWLKVTFAQAKIE